MSAAEPSMPPALAGEAPSEGPALGGGEPPGGQPARSEAAAQAPWLKRHGAKLAVSVLLGAGLAWLLAAGGLPLVPPREAFSALQWWAVPTFVLLIAVAHVLRAIRWRHLLKPVGDVPLRSVVAVSFISFAVILMSPLRSGEVVRPYLISKRGTVRLWEATGTIAAERVVDGLCVSIILFLGLRLSTPMSPLPDHVGDLHVPVSAVPGAAYLVLSLFTASFAMMALFFWRRAWVHNMVRAGFGRISRPLAEVLGNVVERVADGLRFLPSTKLMVPFLIETAGYWAALAAGTWVLALGSGLTSITVAEACVTMGCVAIGILVPSGPGFFGAFQLSGFMALAMFFPEGTLKGAGAAFVFLYYVVQVAANLVAAVTGMIMDPAAPPPVQA